MSKRKIDWEKLFFENQSKIDQSYMLDRYRQSQHGLDYLFLGYSNNETYESYIKRLKSRFLDEIEKGFIIGAFQNLQKQIPVLAELILLECFNGRLLNREIFTKIFLSVFIYAKKDRTTFSNELSNARVLVIFQYCISKLLTSKNDSKYFKTLPKSLVIYRGVAGKVFDDAKSGISWTLKVDVAETFAKYNFEYYNSNSAMILKADILKKDIIAYIDDAGRNEAEIIISPEKLMNIRIEKEIFK